MSLIQNYKSILKNHFKSINDAILDPLVSDNLLCPKPVPLPQTLIPAFQQTIAAFYSLRKNPEYIKKYHNDLNELGIKDPGNNSLFMSYDFHLTADHQPKLIEINTNAAFLTLGQYLYEAHQLPTGINFKNADFKNLFLKELELQGKSPAQPRVLILDEKPNEQRLFLEFLIVQELLQSFGWSCAIDDVANYPHHNVDLVYNRFTDFYFKTPVAQPLREDFLSRRVCFTPNPFEYFLLADKQRMIDWCEEDFWRELNTLSPAQKICIQNVLPKTISFKPELKDEIWSQRKHLFFKPKNSFGSKQSYKGASISKKVFDDVANENFLAQELVPPSEVAMATPDGTQNFKFDLRCYAYQDQLQLVIARVYQGQVTNLKTKWGGFAPVMWTE
ncbi:MAG: hypothetical protein JNL11_15745 [Bdellovibrionaceae bacterium]|nr:hypothetical protein [Pseudobdellovibrionaceae bacterium]